jgi:Uma2 family endonuclease
MASAVPVPWLSPEEYLAIERRAAFKSEYYNGEMFAMSGASLAHNTIAANIAGELRQRLRASPCRPVQSDMRVKIPPARLYTYPDVAVVCPPVQLEDDHGDTLLNPVVIFEVLSDSTENYDRGRKFEHYRKLASLREYLLVSQHAPHVEHYTRADNGTWVLRDATGLEAVLRLTSIGCELPLGEIYAKVELKEPEPEQTDAPPAER